MQPNTWKYFPFPEISISEKYVFSEKCFTATKHSRRNQIAKPKRNQRMHADEPFLSLKGLFVFVFVSVAIPPTPSLSLSLSLSLHYLVKDEKAKSL